MKKINLNRTKLLLTKEKVTTLTSQQMSKFQGGYEMTLVNFTCETDTSPNTNVECYVSWDNACLPPPTPTGIINSIQACLCS